MSIESDTGSAHYLGPENAKLTLTEFGDFGCPHCAQARMPIQSLLERHGKVRLRWRHYYDTELHPGADLAAEASEAAAAQGAFWPMHEALLGHGESFDRHSLIELAGNLSLDTDRVAAELETGRWRELVAADFAAARSCGVSATPTFFIGGERLAGPWRQLRTALPEALRDLSASGEK